MAINKTNVFKYGQTLCQQPAKISGSKDRKVCANHLANNQAKSSSVVWMTEVRLDKLNLWLEYL